MDEELLMKLCQEYGLPIMIIPVSDKKKKKKTPLEDETDLSQAVLDRMMSSDFSPMKGKSFLSKGVVPYIS